MDNQVPKPRESFIFYKSFCDALDLIPTNKEYRKVIKAIFDYAIHDKKANSSDFSDTGKMVLMLIAPQLKMNKIKYQNGLKGGRPKPT